MRLQILLSMNNSKFNKAYYIDSYSKGNLHEMFDASSLLVFSKMFDSIEYRADKSSKKSVEILLNELPLNIKYKPIFVFNDGSVYSRFIKQILATIINCYFIIRSCISDIVIINYNTMLSVYPINLITKILKRNVLVICHGEMYDLKYQRQTSFLFRKSKTLFSKRKTVLAEGLYFAVLGDFVLENLKDVVSPQVYRKIISIDHTFVPQKVKKQNTANEKIKIGVIGSLRKSKGLDDLLIVVKETLQIKNNIEFVVIGSFDFEASNLKKLGFTIPDNIDGSFLSREKMMQLISSIDFALFLLPKDIYQFTASGSFFDAIDCEVPVIALKNDFFEYYYNKYGKFGYLFNSVHDIIEALSHQNCRNDNFDFTAIKENLMIEKIADKLLNSNECLFNQKKSKGNH